jgi:hypothetical protein
MHFKSTCLLRQSIIFALLISFRFSLSHLVFFVSFEPDILIGLNAPVPVPALKILCIAKSYAQSQSISPVR